jgi:23S rRNA (cytosine1962-C5)-methyltransferase
VTARPRPGRPSTRRAEEPPAIPDRPLEVEGPLPVVAIRSAGRHPFVYKKMIAGPVGSPRPKDGDLVRVVDRDETPIGYGLWNSRSQIALRILRHGGDPPGPEFWSERIETAVRLRRDVLALDETTNAYRLVHAEGDGLSGLIIDRFDDTLSVEVFSLGMYQRIGPILRRVAPLAGTSHFRVSVDERIAKAEDFHGRPVASEKAPEKVTIHEHGLRYRVRFEQGHKTGFFCDQRDNRRELARFCRDRTVLDLCAYTGGFGLNALVRGQAREVTCVDLDEKAIAVARENANLNQVRPGLVHADAFGYARQMAANGRQYGVVVLDPPKLIPGRLDIAAGKRKYFDLNALALNLVEPGGLFLTCSCSGLLSRDEFLTLLRASARRAGRSAQILAVTGASADHPVGLEALEGEYLKAVWMIVGDRRAPDEREPADDLASAPAPASEE